jgi:hypothetical protein
MSLEEQHTWRGVKLWCCHVDGPRGTLNYSAIPGRASYRKPSTEDRLIWRLDFDAALSKLSREDRWIMEQLGCGEVQSLIARAICVSTRTLQRRAHAALTELTGIRERQGYGY